MRQPKLTLTIIYYIVLLLAVVAAMIGYYIFNKYGIIFPKSEPSSTTLYTILLWWIIISIPASYATFNLQLKKIREIENIEIKYKKYNQAATLRMCIITVGLVASIIAYYLTMQMSIFWLAGIEAIYAIICKPTTHRIDKDLNIDQDETSSTQTPIDNTNETH